MSRMRSSARYGTVAIIIRRCRRSRASNHYAVRFVNNDRFDIIKNRFATAVLTNSVRDFWRDAKRVCGSKHEPRRTVVGLSQPDDIAGLFVGSYEDTYSCVGFCKTEMAGLKEDIKREDFA
jgi:hypothetical protein